MIVHVNVLVLVDIFHLLPGNGDETWWRNKQKTTDPPKSGGILSQVADIHIYIYLNIHICEHCWNVCTSHAIRLGVAQRDAGVGPEHS